MATTAFDLLQSGPTQGIRANRVKEFPVLLRGDRWYSVLQKFEARAVEATEFDEIAFWVLLVLDCRQQLRKQGF